MRIESGQIKNLYIGGKSKCAVKLTVHQAPSEIQNLFKWCSKEGYSNGKSLLQV